VKTDQKEPPPRRQKRGKQRIESLLHAAEEVFAETGYERATTNAIAARASVSPGTLYQFFPNKAALAEALGRRYAADLESVHERVFHDGIATAPLPDLINATINPFLQFHRRAPAFEALFLAAAVSPDLARRIQFLHDTVSSRIVRLFRHRTPFAKIEDLRWAAETSVAILRGSLPLIMPLKGGQRRRAIRELKIALARYLDPILAPPV